MDRHFDYAQRILVAVEIGAEPVRLADMPLAHSLFQRLSLPEITQAAGASGHAAKADGPAFRALVDRHMSYWEERVPAGQRLFVHHGIGDAETVARTFDRLAAERGRFTALGVYHVEPQSSAYPASFPVGASPSHWDLGKTYGLTLESIFWFNFFPAQPFLFEKTFRAWARFQAQKLAARGENNQLVASDGEDRLVANGVDPFVLVNLNRFTSLPGFFGSAGDAGESTFSDDPSYVWYGMLLRKIG